MFQFGPGETKPSLTLGQQLQPGPGKHQLCMPTDVAVATTGEVFVSDGYCNSRVLKFDPTGSLLRIYPEGRGECVSKANSELIVVQPVHIAVGAGPECFICHGAGRARRGWAGGVDGMLRMRGRIN